MKQRLFSISLLPQGCANVLKAFESGGIDALHPQKKGRLSMKKVNQKLVKKGISSEGTTETLQEELERLRMENAYLKKLNALVQNKEKSPNMPTVTL